MAALLLAGCARDKHNSVSQHTAVVKMAVAERADGNGTLQFPCKVKAGSEVNQSFKLAGSLKCVCVKEGQRVVAGQLLAELDDTDYRVQLSATEAEYAQVKAEAERVMQLYEQGATTASNNDKARYGLQQIEAKLANHRNQLSYCRIYAAEAGTVQSTLFEAGETIAAGMPVVRIIGSGRTEVEITVPAAVYTHISDISAATATFTAFGDCCYTLQLLYALPAANASGMYPIRFVLNGSDVPSPGMNGWVTLTLNSHAGVGNLLVPSTALLHNADGDFIYRVSDGKAQLVALHVVTLTSDGKAIVNGGVNPGDSIVSSGVHSIVDGQRVEALQPASATNVGGLL